MITVTTIASLQGRVTTATQLVADQLATTASLPCVILTEARLVPPQSAVLASYDSRSDYVGLSAYMAYAPEGSADDAAVWVVTVIYTTAAGEVATTATHHNVKWTDRYSL